MSYARRLRRRQARTRPGQPGTEGAIRGVADLLGKRILVTNDPRRTTHEDLERHLAQFNLPWTLRRLGELSEAIGEKSGIVVGDHPVPAYCIPYLALVAIEASDDTRERQTTHEDLAEAARIYVGIHGENLTGDRVLEFLLRLGYQQFASSDMLHSLARTWMLYEKVWPNVPEASSISVYDSLTATLGLDLNRLLFFSMLHLVTARKGYVLPTVDEDAARAFGKRGITLADEETYFGAVSATYGQIRKLANLPSYLPTISK